MKVPEQWKRDAEKVHAALYKSDQGQILTRRACKILIPERYTEKGLATIGADIFIVGIFAIVIDDTVYGVSKTNAMMQIKPSIISTVKFDGDHYLQFDFEPGSVVIETTQLVKDDSLVYRIFDEHISKGKIPWYLDYQKDLGGLFDSSGYHAGLDFGANHVILEMIAAAITRDAKNPVTYYRHLLKDESDLKKKEPVVIPLRSVTYGATNTTSKLVGSYYADGLTAALVNPADKVEKIESLLRM